MHLTTWDVGGRGGEVIVLQVTVFFGFGQGVGGGEWEGDMLFAGAAADSGDRLSGNRFLRDGSGCVGLGWIEVGWVRLLWVGLGWGD